MMCRRTEFGRARWAAVVMAVLAASACSGEPANGGCLKAPPMRESIAAYENTLASIPFDEPLAWYGGWYSVEEYNALVAVLGDPPALDEEPPARDTAVEILTLEIRRSPLRFDVRIGAVFTYSRRGGTGGMEDGRPVPVESARRAGPLMMQLFDKDGALLYERWYPVQESGHVDPALPGGEGLPQPDPASYSEWVSVRVNSPPRWSCLRMIADKTTDPDRADPPGSLAVDIAASPNPPVVEITAPLPEHVFRPGEPVGITWTAHDPDGDELTYRLQTSEDGGRYYGGSDRASTSATYTLYSPIPDTIRLRVVASDGTRSTVAESPTYRVEP